MDRRKRFDITPWRNEFDKIFDEMARATENFKKNFIDMFKEPMLEGEKLEIFEPTMDLIDKGETYEAIVDVPGIDKKNIEINVTNDGIEIKGEQEKGEKKEEKNYIIRERTYKSFYRSIKLPEEVLPDESKAKMENGTLKITLKKKNPKPIEQKETKKIPIE